MRVLLIDSGLGSLSAASVLRTRWPTIDIVLAMDPDHMPWGSLSPEQVVERAAAATRSAGRPDAVLVACNTASVLALDALRSCLEPEVPVIGTVPAVKPAAAACRRVAVWSTPAMAASDYHRALVATHRGEATVETLGCDGLAVAIERADPGAVRASVAHWAAQTPEAVDGLVLACTHYRLVADAIAAALPSVRLFDSAEAVVAQLGRRLGLGPDGPPGGNGALEVLLSGRPAPLPDRALAYPQGRLLAAT